MVEVLKNSKFMKAETCEFDVGKASESCTMLAIRGTDHISKPGAESYMDDARTPSIVARTNAERADVARDLLDLARAYSQRHGKLSAVDTETLMSEPTTPYESAYRVDSFVDEEYFRIVLKGRPATREAYRRKLFEAISILNSMDAQEESAK